MSCLGGRVAAIGLLACLVGCAFSGPIAKDAVRYNEALAQAQNEMLLRNIARASRKHPLFFTTVTEVSRTLPSKSSVSMDFPFGEGGDHKYVAKLSLPKTHPAARILTLPESTPQSRLS